MKNTRLIKSAIMVLAVVAIVAGATYSFFSDTETSTGNTFTAGEIDLKVDNTTHYNGCVCDDATDTWKCEPWADFVVSSGQLLRKNGTAVLPDRSDPAKALGLAESNGSASDSPVITGSFFSLGFGGSVVLGFTNRIVNGSGNDLKIFEVTGGTYPDEKLKVEASKDNINWVLLGEITRDSEVDLGALDWAKYVRLTDTSDVLLFEPEADGYDLDGVQALHCECEPAELETQACNNSWALTDLGATHKFFDFADIKPGDRGEDTLSLHVYNNDAFACLTIHNVENNENDLIDPETEAGDNSPSAGELAENLNFFAWSDDGDNIWEAGEQPLFDPLVGSGTPLLDGEVYPLYLPPNPLIASQTKFIGLAWCAGTMTVDANIHSILCDGSSVDNKAQTDSFKADITFYVEQARNNGQFVCPSVNP